MKLLILNASPRRSGNISLMAGTLKQEAERLGAEVEEIWVQALTVRPCTGCMACRSRHACVLPEDDAQRVLEKIKAADALAVAAPCYWGNMPGTLKQLFDRLVYGLMDENSLGLPLPLHKGKRCVLMSTSTTPWPFNIMLHQSHGAIRAMKEVCKYSGFKIVATIEKGGTKGKKGLPERVLRRCRKAAGRLVR